MWWRSRCRDLTRDKWLQAFKDLKKKRITSSPAPALRRRKVPSCPHYPKAQIAVAESFWVMLLLKMADMIDSRAADGQRRVDEHQETAIQYLSRSRVRSEWQRSQS